MKLILPENYDPILTVRETQDAIKYIRDTFQKELGKVLGLSRISAPLFVEKSSGLNDNLNGIERPVSFDMKELPNDEIEVVQSLAKWKRLALKKYDFEVHEGLYTNMNAIRRDEEVDNTHSCYVDQWDWEKIIRKEDRNENTLKDIVNNIYEVFKDTERYVNENLVKTELNLPESIYFITTQELEDRYPDISSKEREDAICKEFGAVFIMKIGGLLKSGEKHDGRSPDYDDWNLNGDILFWYPLFNKSVELSSMGIRVDEKALDEQLRLSGNDDRRKFEFHKLLLEGKLPYTVGGGIGQSRICMIFLNKAHIGEVQASIWDEKNIEICKENNIKLL